MRTPGIAAATARGVRLIALVVAGALAAVTLGIAGVTTPTRAAAGDGVGVSATFANFGLLQPGVDSSATITVTNGGSTALAGADVTLTAADVDVTTTSGLADWLGSNDAARGPELASAPLENIAVNASGGASLTVPSSAFPWPATWGPRAILVTVATDRGVVARQHTAIVFVAGGAPHTAQVSLVAPLVVSNDDRAVVKASVLEESTSAGGALKTLTDADTQKVLSYAVDPRIPASIAASPNDTPTASAWLKSLTLDTRSTFSLAYGDADLSGQIEAGSPALLDPGVTDPSDAVASALSGTRTTAWPAAGTVNEASLTAFSAAGYQRTLLSASNTTLGPSGIAAAQVGLMPVLVTDDTLSAALSAASAAADDVAYNASMSTVFLRLASLASDPGGQHASIGALSRHLTADSSARLAGVLSDLSRTSWLRLQPLDDTARLIPVATGLVDGTEDPSRLSTISDLLNSVSNVTTFAAIGDRPEFITQPVIRQVMTTLAVGNIGREAWQSAVTASQQAVSRTLNGVSVAMGSTINMIGSTATLPIAIENDLATPVTVVVYAAPRNARLSITSSVEVKVAAVAQGVAKMPAVAQVSNGNVFVDVSLLSTTGVAVGSPRAVSVSIHADWETVGLIIVGVVFVALLAAGVYRTIRRRRMENS